MLTSFAFLNKDYYTSKETKMNKDYIKHYKQALDLFTSENNEEKAIEEYKKSIKMNPYYAQAYYDLAYIYSLKNELKFSIDCYKAYLTFNPDAKDKSEVISTINKLKYKSEINNIMSRLKPETVSERSYLAC